MLHPVIAELHDLSRLHIDDRTAADDIIGTRFRADAITVLYLRIRERTQAMTIPHGIDAVLAHDQKGKCPFQLQRRLPDLFQQRPLLSLDEMQDDLTVAGSLK